MVLQVTTMVRSSNIQEADSSTRSKLLPTMQISSQSWLLSIVKYMMLLYCNDFAGLVPYTASDSSPSYNIVEIIDIYRTQSNTVSILLQKCQSRHHLMAEPFSLRGVWMNIELRSFRINVLHVPFSLRLKLECCIKWVKQTCVDSQIVR